MKKCKTFLVEKPAPPIRSPNMLKHQYYFLAPVELYTAFITNPESCNTTTLFFFPDPLYCMNIALLQESVVWNAQVLRAKIVLVYFFLKGTCTLCFDCDHLFSSSVIYLCVFSPFLGWYYIEKLGDGQKGWVPMSATREIESNHIRARNFKQRHAFLKLLTSMDFIESNDLLNNNQMTNHRRSYCED